ncbi:MAG: diaminopimelate epimerase [Bacteroidales bacterium]|nr:diaminopimelate epimerase [Bacteroidales bacterium]
MKISFAKYHGAGNDFIIIDNRSMQWAPTTAQVSFLCNRHMGIGADGLMLLSEKSGFDFAMTYYNSDGHEGTMCGNGGRCMTAFAKSLGLVGCMANFHAADGIHHSEIFGNQTVCVYRLKMTDTRIGKIYDDGVFVNTGSPHFVKIVEDVANTDIVNAGKKLCNDVRFAPERTNVDFVEIQGDGIFVRTYERGVDDETLSCGTGVTASAMVCAFRDPVNQGIYSIKTLGGNLKVSFTQTGELFTDIWLEGPVMFVFTGEVSV